ncbi:DUF4419 domain-containing protein [Streptomyces phaeochromogenes]
MVTFEIDDVTPAAEPLPTRPLGDLDLVVDALAVGGDPNTLVVEPNGVHPLLGAVGRAFADHRRLVLTPDAVWLTIAQGLAQHIRLHAEELRPRLVRHAGRKRLTVTVDGPMPHDPNSWQDAVELFHKLLAAEIDGTGTTADLFECDFSTSTDVERVVGRIVMLDAYAPYFALWMTFVCGIPSITLAGTVEDWQRIRARLDAVADLGMETWCRSLVPIADQFVRAAAGDIDTAFWRRIYSPVDAYGGEVVTGWIARFYPYLTRHGAVTRPNPLLELPLDEPRDLTLDGMFYTGPGVRSDDVPATLSRLVVHINDRVEGDNRVVALHAGLVGVGQDDDGSLRPVAGWHLTSGAVEMDDVIDRIVRDHATTPAQSPDGLWFEGCADVVALYSRIGSATLFDGAWRLRPIADRRTVWRGHRAHSIAVVIDLADGRILGAVDNSPTGTTHWVVCRIEEAPSDGEDTNRPRLHLVDEPNEVPVYGTSLAFLLDAALDSGGDIEHLETGRLDELDHGIV